MVSAAALGPGCIVTGAHRLGHPTDRLRIALITAYDIRGARAGGASADVSRLARHLAERHDVAIVSFSDSGEREQDEWEGVHLVFLPHSPWTAVARLALLREPWIRQSDVVIESVDAGGPWYAFSARSRVLLAHQLWKEVFVEEVRPPFGALLRLIEPWLYLPYRLTPTILASLSQSASRELRQVGIRNVSMVPFGFHRDPLDAPPVPGAELRSRPILSVVSRLRKYKGVQFAISALPKILELYPDVELVIAGRGPYRQQLEGLTRRLGIVDSVRFLGYVSHAEKKHLLHRSYVSLAPSIREGYGLNVIEAFRSGTTVVGWRVPGTTDAIQDGVTGLLVEPFDVKGLSAVVIGLLDNPEARDRLAGDAYHWAGALDWEESLDQLDRIVEAAASQGDRRRGPPTSSHCSARASGGKGE